MEITHRHRGMQALVSLHLKHSPGERPAQIKPVLSSTYLPRNARSVDPK